MAEKPSGEKIIAVNPNRGNFFLSEMTEAGLVLKGTEIKSLRTQSPNMRDAHIDVYQGEAYLVNCHIPEYSHGNVWNHEPMRKRKLLLHKHQIGRLSAAVEREGMTVIPTRMYFKNGRAKMEIGLAKGKKKYDKRQDIKRRNADREMSRALKRGR